ncbi:MAG: hypothetical protein ACOCWY_03750 [Thermodesulfobacteriota bacterium]
MLFLLFPGLLLGEDLLSDFSFPFTGSSPGAGESPSGRGLADRITAIRLYGVRNGEPIQKTIRKADIQHSRSFAFQGYASGIVVFCEEEMTVRLERERFPKILKKRDGGFAAKYFGDLIADMVPASIRDNNYFEGTRSEVPRETKKQFLKGGYSYFPKVTGNAVGRDNPIRINFEQGKEQFQVEIRQEGFQSGPILNDDHNGSDPRRFHYVGNRLDLLKSRIPDFDLRLAAIQRGIDRVESRLEPDLVSKVILLDYHGIRNAISCEDSDDVWFYIETFEQEPIGELETISAHETLHKYVDRRRLVRHPMVRKRFADLKGFDLISYERFLMVTQGIAPRHPHAADPENRLFFEFINERHFLEDRKGGHSGDNLDEFCTSFLHSLLYIERLEENLNRPIQIGDEAGRLLNGSERKRIVDAYAKTLAVFKKILEEEGRLGTDFIDEVELVERGLELAESLAERMTVAQGPSNP